MFPEQEAREATLITQHHWRQEHAELANGLADGSFPESAEGAALRSAAGCIHSENGLQHSPSELAQACFLVRLTPSLATTLGQDLEITYFIANVIFDFQLQTLNL